MQNSIEITNLSKSFISSGWPWQKKIITCALYNINLVLKRGKSLAILGPNGAGKTTLLKIISTLILPDSGKVIVNGYSLGKDDERIKSNIGLVQGEERSFYWRLTGRQNLECYATLYDLNKNETKSRLKELFKLFKIDYADKRFDSYSTGMKRKFSIMRALVHNPEVLLLDEPTKSLDYNSTQELRAFIKDLNLKGKTIIFATHNIEEAKDLCDLAVILHKGKILAKINSPEADLAKIYLKLTQNA